MSREVSTRKRAGWWRIALIMGSAGVTHFVRPDFYEPIVPEVLPGSARSWVYFSGVVELTCAALLVSPRTRRAGGALSFVTIAGVWPANWKAAEGGMKHVDPPFNSAAASWIRLPLQLPMLYDAYRIARKA